MSLSTASRIRQFQLYAFSAEFIITQLKNARCIQSDIQHFIPANNDINISRYGMKTKRNSTLM